MAVDGILPGVSASLPPRVFLSYTSELLEWPEDRSFVAAAREAVVRTQCVPKDMQDFVAEDRPPAQVCRDAVIGADVYVGIIGFLYGSLVSDQPESSYTELEFDTATRAGRPRLMFLLDEETMGPARLFRDPHHPKQEKFRARICNSKILVRKVKTSDELGKELYDALKELRESIPPQRSIEPEWCGLPPRSRTFTGREELLKNLHDALCESPVVLHGMVGVGKTALAIEYAHREHGGHYDVVLFVSAEQPERIPGQLAERARLLGLAEQSQSTDTAMRRLLGEVPARDRWLLIYDDAEKSAVLTEFLPGRRWHVLVTSRSPEWNELAMPVQVDVLDRTESVGLLRKLGELTEDDADQIADELGDLPLALHQAAACLRNPGVVTQGYLQALREQPTRILSQGVPAIYGKSLAAGLKEQFDQLADEDSAAWELLQLVARLAPGWMPFIMLTRCAELLRSALGVDMSDPTEFGRLTGLLWRMALVWVDRDRKCLRIHRLERAILRDNPIRTRSGHDVTTVITRLLSSLVPEDPWRNPSSWPDWRELLPHILSAVDGADLGNRDVPWLLDRAATYLLAQGKPGEAQRRFKCAHEHYQQLLGGDHPDTLRAANNLALNLTEMNRYDEALELHEKILERRSRILGQDHPDTLASSSNLALVLSARGDHQEACERCEDTVARYRRILGDKHPCTLNSVNNLAECLREQGEYARACDLHEKTWHGYREIRGPDHLDTLNSANNLAVALIDFGERDQACQLLEDTVPRIITALGRDHPDAFNAARNLDFIRQLQDEHE